MAKILDALGRNLEVDVNLTNVNDLTQALLAGVKTRTTTKGEPAAEESTDEIKQIKDLVEQVARCCKFIAANKVNVRKTTREARIYAKTLIAEQKRSKKGGDPTTVLSNNLKRNLNPALNDAADNFESLNSKLAQSAGILGRAFKDSIGSVTKDLKKLGSTIAKGLRLDKLWSGLASGAKLFWEIAAGSVKDIFGAIVTGWSETISGAFKILKDGAASVWTWARKGVSDFLTWSGKKTGELATRAWNSITATAKDYWARFLQTDLGKKLTEIAGMVGDAWNSMTKGVAKAWGYVSDTFSKITGPISRAFSGATTAVGAFVGRAFEPFSKGLKELSNVWTKKPLTAATANAPGGPTTGAIPGAEPPPGATAANPNVIEIPEDEFSPLCACICKCLGKPIQKMARSQDKEAKLASDVSKSTKTMAERIPLIGKYFEPDKRTKREKEKAKREKDEKQARIEGAKSSTLGLANGVREWLKSENPFDLLWQKLSSFTGKAIELPFKLLGGLLETEAFGFKIPVLGEMSRMLGGALGGLGEGIMGFIGDELKDMQEQSQALYTTRGSTGGIQGRAPDSVLPANADQAAINIENWVKGTDIAIEKEKVFGRTVQDVLETGQRLSKLRMQDMKNFKRGISDFKKVTNIGLNTASQIQSDAEQTGELFAGWKTQLGASNYQLSIMGRGMLDVARNTGVFGDQLVNAAKNSETIMKNMRAYGTFSAKAANNVIGLTAAAEKAGVSEGMQNVLGVLQSTLLKGGKGQALAVAGIGTSGKVRDQLIGGTILKDKGAQKELAKNWRKFLDGLSQSMFGGKTYDQLTEGQKGLMSPTVESITQGVVKGPEELNQIIKVFEENTRSFTENAARLNPAVDGILNGLNKSQRTIQKQELIYSTGMEIIDDFDKALIRSKGNIKQAFENIGNDDLKPFLKEINSTGEGAAAIGDIMRKQAEIIRARAKKEGMEGTLVGTGLEADKIGETIEKALKSLGTKDRKEYEALKETLVTLDNQTREQMRRNADPVSRIMATLFQVEAWLKLGTTALISELIPGFSGWLADFEKQSFWKDFAEGGDKTEKAIADMGKYFKELPGRIDESKKNIENIKGSTVAQRGAAGFMAGTLGRDSLGGMMLEGGGKLLQENAKEITKAINDISANLKTLAANIGDITKVIGQFASVFLPAAALAVGILGIGKMITGAGGLVSALSGAGGLAAALGAVAKFALPAAVAVGGAVLIKEEIDRQKSNIDKTTQGIQDQADAINKATEDYIAKQDELRKLSEDELKVLIQTGEAKQKSLAQARANYNKDKEGLGIQVAQAIGIVDEKNFQQAEAGLSAAERQLRTQERLQRNALAVVQAIGAPIETERKLASAQANEEQLRKERSAALKKLNDLGAEKRAQDERNSRRGYGSGPQTFRAGLEQDLAAADKAYRESIDPVGTAGAEAKRQKDALAVAKKEAILKQIRSQANIPKEFAQDLEIAADLLAKAAPNFSKIDTVTGDVAKQLEDLGRILSVATKQEINFIKTNEQLVVGARVAQVAKEEENKALKALQGLPIARRLVAGLGERKHGEMGSEYAASGEVGKRQLLGYLKSKLDLPGNVADLYSEDANVREKTIVAMQSALQKLQDTSEGATKLRDALQTYGKERGKENDVRQAVTWLTQRIEEVGRAREIRDDKKYDPAVVARTYGLRSGKGAEAMIAKGAVKPEEFSEKALEQFMKAGSMKDLDKTWYDLVDPLSKQYMNAPDTVEGIKTANEAMLESAKVLLAYNKAKDDLKIKFAENSAKAITDIRNESVPPGKKSLATHDWHVESLVTESNSLLESIFEAVDATAKATALTSDVAAASALLPMRTVDEEMRKREAEREEDTMQLAEIEASSKDTANNTRKMVSILNNLAKLLSRRRRSGGNVEGNTSDEPFLSEILNTEWPNARQGNTVGLEFDTTDIA